MQLKAQEGSNVEDRCFAMGYGHLTVSAHAFGPAHGTVGMNQRNQFMLGQYTQALNVH